MFIYEEKVAAFEMQSSVCGRDLEWNVQPGYLLLRVKLEWKGKKQNRTESSKKNTGFSYWFYICIIEPFFLYANSKRTFSGQEAEKLIVCRTIIRLGDDVGSFGFCF